MHDLNEDGKSVVPILIFLCLAVAVSNCVLGQCPPQDEARSVVIAKVGSIRVHGRAEYEVARAFYVHENLQPVVVEIVQTLSGPPIPSTVVVFLEVHRTSQFTTEWFGSYGILAREEWKVGDSFVMTLTKNDRYNIPCQEWVPSRLAKDKTTVAGIPDLPEYADPFFPELEQFEDYPGYCASLQSVFRVKLRA